MSETRAGDVELCDECKAPIKEHEQGFCPYEIETGEIIMHSELSGNTYRVTKWVPKSEGHVISLQKEQIESPDDPDTNQEGSR